MHSNLSKALTSLLLVFVLIGQGVAPFASQCDMTNEDQQASEMSMHMEHSQDHVMVMNDMPEHDCCDSLDCSCLEGVCTTTLIASTLNGLTIDISPSTSDYLFDARLTSNTSQLLIRPPIIA